MVVEYQTRQDLLEENAELQGALGEILDEAQKENPDIDFIEGTASEALGIDEDGEPILDSDSEEDI